VVEVEDGEVALAAVDAPSFSQVVESMELVPRLRA